MRTARLALLLALAACVAAPAAEAATLRPVKAVSVTEGDAGTRAVRVRVSLGAAARRPVRVRYATAIRTAAASDFVRRRGTLRIRRGARRATIALEVRGDTRDEPDETFTVRFSQPRGARLGPRRRTTVTIVDDDPAPRTSTPPGASAAPVLSVSDRTVREPDASGAAMPHGLSVTLSEAPTTAVRVDVHLVAAGPTTTADDVDLGGGTVTFTPGQTSAVVPGDVRGDALDEDDEQARVVLSAPSGAGIARGEAVLTIADGDDDLPPVLTIADTSTTEAGGSTARSAVTLSAPSGRVVTVGYATRDGTAVSAGGAEDFTAASGTLALPPGQVAQEITTAVGDDPRDEDAQAYAVVLSQPVNASIGDGEGSVTIADDDPPPSVRIDDVTEVESTSAATFTLSLSEVSERVISLEVDTVAGTATGGATCAAPGADHVRVDGLDVVVAPGQAGASVDVGVCEDAVDEPAETAHVVLSNPVDVALGDASGALTIVDDD